MLKQGKNIFKKACAGVMAVAIMVTGGFGCIDADARVSRTWDTYYIAYNNQHKTYICQFPSHLGLYTANVSSAAGTGAGISNLIQGDGDTVLDRPSYAIKVSTSPKTFYVTSSGEFATYIKSILSFNIGSGTAHTTGTVSYEN